MIIGKTIALTIQAFVDHYKILSSLCYQQVLISYLFDIHIL